MNYILQIHYPCFIYNILDTAASNCELYGHFVCLLEFMKIVNLDYSTTLNAPIQYRQLKKTIDEIKSKTVSETVLNKCLTENGTQVMKKKTTLEHL